MSSTMSWGEEMTLTSVTPSRALRMTRTSAELNRYEKPGKAWATAAEAAEAMVPVAVPSPRVTDWVPPWKNHCTP